MELTCSRCGRQAEALPAPPLPTAAGRLVHEHTCGECWKEWLSAQVILINEYRLNLVDPKVRTQLEGEMRRFLKLPETEGA